MVAHLWIQYTLGSNLKPGQEGDRYLMHKVEEPKRYQAGGIISVKVTGDSAQRVDNVSNERVG